MTEYGRIEAPSSGIASVSRTPLARSGAISPLRPMQKQIIVGSPTASVGPASRFQYSGPLEADVKSAGDAGTRTYVQFFKIIENDKYSSSSFIKPSLAARLKSAEHLLPFDQLTSLTRQVTYIVEPDDEEEDDAQHPSEMSLGILIVFLAHNPWVRHPDLSLSSEGHFRAVWQTNDRNRLTVTFATHGIGSWYAYTSQPKSSVEEGSLYSLDASMLPKQFHNWIIKER